MSTLTLRELLERAMVTGSLSPQSRVVAQDRAWYSTTAMQRYPWRGIDVGSSGNRKSWISERGRILLEVYDGKRLDISRQ